MYRFFMYRFLLEACATAAQGDKRLAEFCTVHTAEEVQRFLDQAWAVREAPQRALAAQATRVERLQAAAGRMPCVCGGIWAPGASRVLSLNGEDPRLFGHDVCLALSQGAKRGVNMAVIGRPGCGKSMMFEWMDQLFCVSGKPERDSSFPLSGILNADVLLWQEFTYNKETLAFEDLLSVLVGELTAVRVPGAPPVQHRNKAPMFYTARAGIAYRSGDPEEVGDYNLAVAERFNTRRWSVQLPMPERRADFPACAPCAARFYLECAAAHIRFSHLGAVA